VAQSTIPVRTGTAENRDPAGVAIGDRRDAEALPNLLGGSADLTHSNLTRAKTQHPGAAR
jgi:transketolase